MILLQQMSILFVIMLVGFVCKKKGLITNAGSKAISGIVVNVANPALILSAGINKTETIEGKNLLYAVLLAIGVYVFLIIGAVIIPLILRIPKNDKGTYQVMTVFSNIGFMGFPVISAAYGSDALLYASFFLIPFNVLIYTWGIMAMSPGEVSKEGSGIGSRLRKILNVGVISCIVTIICYLMKLQLPYPVESVVHHFSNLTAPLSMMIIGASMTDMKIKDLLGDAKLILFILIKMLVLPIIGLVLVKDIGLEPDLIGVCLIMLATPVGSMTAMLAEQYDGDYELASKGVALSTVVAVATIPFLSLILGV